MPELTVTLFKDVGIFELSGFEKYIDPKIRAKTE